MMWIGLIISVLVFSRTTNGYFGRFNSSLPLEGAVGGTIHFSLVSSFFFVL